VTIRFTNIFRNNTVREYTALVFSFAGEIWSERAQSAFIRSVEIQVRVFFLKFYDPCRYIPTFNTRPIPQRLGNFFFNVVVNELIITYYFVWIKIELLQRVQRFCHY